jgi:hypothetical protein
MVTTQAQVSKVNYVFDGDLVTRGTEEQSKEVGHRYRDVSNRKATQTTLQGRATRLI